MKQKNNNNNKKGSSNQRQQSKRLRRQYHLPEHLASRVSNGEMTLKDAIAKNREQQMSSHLMTKHQLSHSDAIQVARGSLDLQKAIFDTQFRNHFATHEFRSILQQSFDEQIPISLYLHNIESIDGIVSNLDKYEITISNQSLDSEISEISETNSQVIHKLQIKACRLLSSQHLPETLGTTAAPPIEHPRDRFHISTKHLFSIHRDASSVRFTLLEGMIVKGTISWVGRFAIGIIDCRGQEIVIYRHALTAFELEEVEK